MLRVRPILFTADASAWKHVLEALGLVCVQNQAGWMEFDAGSGRVALHHSPTGSPGGTVFGVEVGDLAEFARRTVADGTRAELIDADLGQAVRITAHDGFTFLADKATSRTTSPDADPALAVVGTWLAPDVPQAAGDMRNIGARARNMSPGAADFTCKNGGILQVRQSGSTSSGPLAFEYDGDPAALEVRLAAAGLTAARSGGSLTVPAPGGASISVALPRPTPAQP
ncbi:hypothetical protein [Arthrobacter sp. NyZ413]|uniref:hypothetical protein n=1 Tax=Arthrobacter sp. NyZ413 TaxID=3144669 RepID=UPI003BF83200